MYKGGCASLIDLSVTRKEMVHYFIHWAGTVMCAGCWGYGSSHRHGLDCKGQQAKKYSTHGEHHDGHRHRVPGTHRGAVPNTLEGQGHFLKKVGLSSIFQDT